VFWLRKVGILLVMALTLIAFAGVQETPGRLRALYRDFWSHRATLQQDWKTARSGEEVLAPKVRTMLALLREQRVESFRYSRAIAHEPDASVIQRIAESAYPIRLTPTARHLLALSGEPLDPGCKVLASQQEVVIAACP
jgi:hypothetical protein